MALTKGTKILRFLGFNTQGDLGPFTFYTSKRKGLVFFVKAPPLEPASIAQQHQRNRFAMASGSWRQMTVHQRAQWQLAAERAGLKVTGLNLYMYWVLKQDNEVLATVSRQSGVVLPAFA